MSKHKTDLQIADPADAAREEPVASIQKIRDILFGGQMREYEGRFAEIEQLLFSDLAKLRAELGQGMKRMEQELRAELRRQAEAAEVERAERLQIQKAADRRLAQLGEALLAKLAAVERQGSEQLQALRSSVDGKVAALDGVVHSRFGEIEQQQARGRSGNEDLATLLHGIADRLGQAPG